MPLCIVPVMSDELRVIVITGTMGSGKTTVLAEASDILTACGVAHAAIDLDALGIAHLPDAAPIDLAYRNLSAVWSNYAALGVTRLLLAGAIENRDELNRILAVLPDAAIVLCRLTATLATMQQRVSLREPGMLHDKLVARVSELDEILDRAGLEDFSLSNDDGSVTRVATELLARSGWI
jgi:adenylylsulfate kinase